jgi:hypothetical protein
MSPSIEKFTGGRIPSGGTEFTLSRKGQELVRETMPTNGVSIPVEKGDVFVFLGYEYGHQECFYSLKRDHNFVIRIGLIDCFESMQELLPGI